MPAINKLQPTIDVDDALSTITWNGWTTRWQHLRQCGWEITLKTPYDNWTQPEHSAASHEYAYIRHPPSCMLGRITKANRMLYARGHVWELDWLMPEHNQRVKAPAIITDRELTADDIPALMGIILSLQTPPAKRRIKPEANAAAEILLLKNAS